MIAPARIPRDRLCCIYDDAGDDTFRVGYLICHDNSTTLWNLFTTRGYEDGFYLTPSNEIFRLDFDNPYTARISGLMRMHGQRPASLHPETELPLAAYLLQYSKANSIYVTVMLDNGDRVTGEVADVGEACAMLAVVDDDGKQCGTSIIRNDAIVRIWSDSGVERSIQELSALQA